MPSTSGGSPPLHLNIAWLNIPPSLPPLSALIPADPWHFLVPSAIVDFPSMSIPHSFPSVGSADLRQLSAGCPLPLLAIPIPLSLLVPAHVLDSGDGVRLCGSLVDGAGVVSLLVVINRLLVICLCYDEVIVVLLSCCLCGVVGCFVLFVWFECGRHVAVVLVSGGYSVLYCRPRARAMGWVVTGLRAVTVRLFYCIYYFCVISPPGPALRCYPPSKNGYHPSCLQTLVSAF